MSHHPEDALDVRLTERAIGRLRTSEIPQAGRAQQRPQDSSEIEPLLNAAARLDLLRDAAPSAAFADDLERRLMARLNQATPRKASRRRPRPMTLFTRIPTRAAWASIAAALALTVGLGVFTAQAAPGQPLYPVRQLAQHVAADAFPSPTAATPSSLDRARLDLAAYNAEIAQGNSSTALATLRTLRADDIQAATDAAALTDASARQVAQAQVERFRQGAQANLRASLATLDWQGRAQVTDALRSWGDAALVVTSAHIMSGAASSHSQHDSTSADLLIEARGAGFASGAQVLVNGQPVGNIVSLTPTKIVAHVAASKLTGDILVIGVQAEDGTVALTSKIGRDDGATPSSAATPGDGAHNDGHGASNGGGSNGSSGNATWPATPSSHPQN